MLYILVKVIRLEIKIEYIQIEKKVGDLFIFEGDLILYRKKFNGIYLKLLELIVLLI